VANAGDTIENPFSGERITFLRTAAETDGELLRFEYVLPPGFSIPEHVHPRQEERHEIVSGTLRGRVAGQERDFGRGERVIGPAGVPHAWRNPSDDEELLIISELRPPLGFETLIETGFAIAGALKTDSMGAPKHLLRILILLDEAGGEFYPAGVPMPVWRAFLTLVAAIARVGRLLGYEAHSAARRPTGVWGRVAVVLAAGLAGTVVFALLRRRSGNRRSISG
jgi:mannose-6-phosphate isomerase-like protein (cupin superfamily)